MQDKKRMKKSHKIILTLSILLVAGFTWSLDMPIALQVPLREQPYSFSNFQYNFVYFATYTAIFFSDMPVGMLLDKLPIKKTVIFIALISLASQLGILIIFYFQFSGYKIVFYICRGIFGITGQGLFTIQALLISLYGGKYYDMLIGVGICAPFVFDSINNILTPLIYDSTKSMQLAWGIGVFFCFFALCCGMMISRLVLRQDKLKQNQQQSLLTKQQQQQEEALNFNGLKKMPRQFWVIIGAVFFTEYVIGSYIDNLNDTIVKRFKISYVNAGYLMFLPYGAASIISFGLGFLLQKKPKLRRPLMASSTITYSIGLLIMYFLPNVQDGNQPTIMHYIVIALQFATMSYLLSILYGVLSSSIVYVVEPRYLGIGWGVIGSTIGISEATSPLIITWILQSEDTLPEGYKKLTLIIFIASLFALGFSLWILFGQFQRIDVNSSGKLDNDGLKQSLLQQQKQVDDKHDMKSDQIMIDKDSEYNKDQIEYKKLKECIYF